MRALSGYACAHISPLPPFLGREESSEERKKEKIKKEDKKKEGQGDSGGLLVLAGAWLRASGFETDQTRRAGGSPFLHPAPTPSHVIVRARVAAENRYGFRVRVENGRDSLDAASGSADERTSEQAGADGRADGRGFW